MKYLSLIFCLIVVLLFSCNEVNPKGEKEVRNFVKQWSDAHTQIKAPYLERYYMDVVTYYGKERTRSQVQQDKNLLFQQFPDYTERILNDQFDITKEAVSYLVKFIKRVNYNGIEADYTFYLSVMTKNRDFKILREDVDKNLKEFDARIFPINLGSNATTSNNRKLYGDFNGDGLSDFASVSNPQIISVIKPDVQNSDEVHCTGGCN
ncbi:MAG: hypothetical protein HKO01_04325, partial [Flaviramulus sp.]